MKSSPEATTELCCRRIVVAEQRFAVGGRERVDPLRYDEWSRGVSVFSDAGDKLSGFTFG